jgi:hypothetical protein
MSASVSSPLARPWVRVSTGYIHPVLGSIGGWKGPVLRSFTAGGTRYLDLELSAGTIRGLPKEEVAAFFQKAVVFTRIRLPERATETTSPEGNEVRQLEATKAVQRRWYAEIGKAIVDPTQIAANEAGEPDIDERRRKLLVGLAAAGLAILVLEVAKQSDRSGSGSWGRAGGGFHG